MAKIEMLHYISFTTILKLKGAILDLVFFFFISFLWEGPADSERAVSWNPVYMGSHPLSLEDSKQLEWWGRGVKSILWAKEGGALG